MPRPCRTALCEHAEVIHFCYEAWLATLAILVWHFYAVIFRPGAYPMSWVWLSGKMTGRQMGEEHSAELAEIVAREAANRLSPGEASPDG